MNTDENDPVRENGALSSLTAPPPAQFPAPPLAETCAPPSSDVALGESGVSGAVEHDAMTTARAAAKTTPARVSGALAV
jgi:hypothetical protein